MRALALALAVAACGPGPGDCRPPGTPPGPEACLDLFWHPAPGRHDAWVRFGPREGLPSDWREGADLCASYCASLGAGPRVRACRPEGGGPWRCACEGQERC